MDMHLINQDVAGAQTQAQQSGGAPAQGMPSQQQQQHLITQPPGGGYAQHQQPLQPSHQPSQHQLHHQLQQQQHHIPPGYAPASSHQGRNTASSPSSTGGNNVGGNGGVVSSPPAAPQGRLGHVLHTMQQTGFHSWGFVIYRGCSYGDEATWQRFIAHMKREVHDALGATPKLPPASGGSPGGGGGLDLTGRQLAPYLEWTLIEDPSLQGCSKDAIRQHFAAWSAARTPQRDGPGADGPFIESHVPRFMYCVYIDQRCLQTLVAFDDWLRIDRNGPMQYLACIIIDKNCPEQGEGDAGMIPVDGCERYYTGWMYAHVGSLPELYNTLGHQRLISGPNNYARPPRIYPGHLYGASV